MDKLWKQLCKKYNYVSTFPKSKIYKDGVLFESIQLEPGIEWGGTSLKTEFFLQNHMTQNVNNLKAIIYGPGRTGSAILTDICFYLFGPEHVYPTHRNKFINAKNDTGAPTLLAIRDFRNSMVSHWRVKENITKESMDDGAQMNQNDLEYYLNNRSKYGSGNFLLRIQHLKDFIEERVCGIDYQPIYYEKVLGNIPAVLKIIETYFKIQIPDVNKKYLDMRYNVKNKSKYFTGDRNTEENTYNLGVTDWRNHIPENLYDYVYDKLKPHLKLWGYDRQQGDSSVVLGEEVHKMAIRETKQKKG
jgi:hypothetical protein